MSACHAAHVLTVELRDVSGRVPVQFDIMPSTGLSQFIAESQFKLAQQLAATLGLRYYFLVNTDIVRGWNLSDGRQVFAEATEPLLLPYAETPDRIRTARAGYLAQLTQAWVADLASHWKSGSAPAPGETAMDPGALSVIRSAEAATSGSL